MTTVQEATRMREKLYSVYNHSPKWVKKVNLMSTDQLTAIFMRFKRDGKIN